MSKQVTSDKLLMFILNNNFKNGVRIIELSEKMNIPQTGLFVILKRLELMGLVKKEEITRRKVLYKTK